MIFSENRCTLFRIMLYRDFDLSRFPWRTALQRPRFDQLRGAIIADQRAFVRDESKLEIEAD
jgi:hypothetical protein